MKDYLKSVILGIKINRKLRKVTVNAMLRYLSLLSPKDRIKTYVEYVKVRIWVTLHIKKYWEDRHIIYKLGLDHGAQLYDYKVDTYVDTVGKISKEFMKETDGI